MSNPEFRRIARAVHISLGHYRKTAVTAFISITMYIGFFYQS